MSHLDYGTPQGRRSRAERGPEGLVQRGWSSGAGGPKPLAGGRRNSTRPSSTQQPPPPHPDGTCSLLALPLRPFVVCSWACEGRSIRKPWGHSVPIPSHLAGRRRTRPQNILQHRVLDSALSCSLWCPSRLREGALLAPSVPAPGKPHIPLESNWSGPAGICDARLDWADG